MQKSKINRIETGLFSIISNRLSYQQNSLQKYIETPFSETAFQTQIDKKKNQFTKEKRVELVNALEHQYKKLNVNNEVISNIKLLEKDTTFTVTTGHQLSIFTGPIYFIYKILHVIKLTQELKSKNPENDFVPLFWLASEDHDFEEIQSVPIFGNSIKWETDQKGPVGRFDFSSFEQIKSSFLSFFKQSESEVYALIDNYYKGETLGEATLNLVNHLFQEYGLVIVDGDSLILKNSFKEIAKREITTAFSHTAVTITNQELEAEGVKTQVYPREINLFYIEDNFRERIQLIEDEYYIEGKGTYSQVEILQLIEDQPEKFSPNVVLRPLYQEFILPNLCYVGGGGEMAYWLQLKGVFDSFGCVYPLIQVRNSLLHIDASSQKKIDNLHLTINDLFLKSNDLKKKYVLKYSSNELNFKDIDASVNLFSDNLKKLVHQIDIGLSSYAEAEIARFNKQVENIQQKLIKTEKVKHEQYLNQIDQIKEKLFPNEGVQERKMNFFNLCANGEVKSHIQTIYRAIDPFENDLIIY